MRQHSLLLDKTLLTAEMLVCDNFIERGRGLLFRKPLDAARGQALLIPRCNSVHTFWMSYPITVIFLDSTGLVVSIAPNMLPWRVAGSRRASFVLECAVGTSWAQGLCIGQKLSW
jgi:uncharacterized protein